MTRTTAESTSWALLGAVLAGTAGHWFITPIRHPNPPTWKVVVVAVQLLAGVAFFVYGTRLQRRERQSERVAAQFEDGD